MRDAVTALQSSLGAPPLAVQIALVADPIDSGLAYQFDTQLQAIRLGFERRVAEVTYYRNGGWLPWDDRAVESSQRAASKECRRSTPGVLLFRGGDGDPGTMAVLVVGESPTSGIHQHAMRRALEAAEVIASSNKGLDESAVRPLSIIGPTFSGSTQSLMSTLRDWTGRDAPANEQLAASGSMCTPQDASSAEGPASAPRFFNAVDLRSGSATGPRVAQDIRESRLPGYEVSFSATTPPEAAVQCSYLMYLRCRLGVGRGSLERCAPEGPTKLSEVALLRESGTEFGANEGEPVSSEENGSTSSCPVHPGVDLRFPVHISAVRDAYEEADRRGEAQAELVGRLTQLPISLHESAPLDLDAQPSARTTYARDLALAKVLNTITRDSVRHVGIQATDIGDAIFLARKIRDLAPDVRIAFFTSDVLLLHSVFARDLDGSIVVSPYPFLGSSTLATPRAEGVPPPSDITEHNGFENATSLAVFNAVLAARGASREQLREYAFTSRNEALPIWISAIGAGAFVPLSVAPSRDEHCTIEFGQRPEDCDPPADSDTYNARRRALRDSRLTAAGNASPPRLWHFAFALASMAWLMDWLLQRRALRMLCRTPVPVPLGAEHDQRADLAMSRTKWRLYGWIRSVVLAGVASYMGVLYWLASGVYTGFEMPLLGTLLIGAVVAGTVFTARRAYQSFRRDYRNLVRWGAPRWRLVWSLSSKPFAGSVGAAAARVVRYRESASFWSGAVRMVGLAPPIDRRLAAITSVAQLRVLKILTWTLLVLFAVGHLGAMSDEGLASDALPTAKSPAATLWVMRSLALVGAAAPSAPTLLCAALVYVWALGRQARLHLVHGLCRMAPAQATLDLVSTPLCAVLYPAARGSDSPSDEGFARVERAVGNAILRPITGPSYATALAVFAFLPVVLFMLKPPSTLERDSSTTLLAAALGLAVLLIGSTLIQLVQFWLALDWMLKRMVQHPIGSCFTRVDPRIRGTADQQLSRTPSEVLRLAVCQARFDELVQEGRRDGLHESFGIARLDAMQLALSECKQRAVSVATERPTAEAAWREAKLGRAVIEAAGEVMDILEQAWDGTLKPGGAGAVTAPADAAPIEKPASDALRETGNVASTASPVPMDLLAARAHCYDPAELRWLRHAEELVASTLALLVNRHVRQVPLFVSTLIASVLLLVLAVQSYPFEPHVLMLNCIWMLASAVVLTALWVYFSVQKNVLLSEIAGTAPGRVTWDGALIIRVIAWGIVPLLGVAAVQYPEAANRLLRFIAPFMRAIQ